MKAIIIAAGIGRRMKPLTEALPKCMLDFNGKTLLETHIETLKSCGINDISVIKGYKAEKIIYPCIKYYLNDRFEYNNILNSLFFAEAEINDDVVVSYSDILYQKAVLDKLLAESHDFSVAVDTDWKLAYHERQDHPVSEAEKVELSSDGRLIKIGKTIDPAAQGEFIGLMKISKKGSMIFRDKFQAAKRSFWGKPFHEAAIFEKAYLTDMVQELVDNKIDVYGALIQGGWKEIDTIQDYENAKKLLQLR